jgi:Ran GTPase-activating protein (RanGAP) involved in mRNA processing and transport
VNETGIKAPQPRKGAPSTFSKGELLQDLRVDVRHKAGKKEAALLIEELIAHGSEPLSPLRLCCSPRGGEQDPLTDKDLPLLLERIDQWVDTLPGGTIKLDLSGNQITAYGVTLLGACLSKHSRVQELDLSNSSFGPPPTPRKNTLTKHKTVSRVVRKMTSPRGPRKVPTVGIGQAIAELLTNSHLRGVWLNGNAFARSDRESIILGVKNDPHLCALGLTGCALSEFEIGDLVRAIRRKHLQYLAVTPPTKLAVDCIADELLPGNKTLLTLNLETPGPHSTLDVTRLFDRLNSSECLEVLSLAGHDLFAVPEVVTEALLQNTTLRKLDLSHCDLQTQFLKGLVAALRQERKGRPNETLTELILPTFNDETFERDEKESLCRLCALALDRNRNLARQKSRAAQALHAGLSSAGAPLNILSPALCRQIVEQIRDVPSLHNLTLVRHRPPPPEDLPTTFPPLPSVPHRPLLRGSSSGKP